MSKIEISRVTIQAHGHATENLDKVKQAILNIIPPSLRDRVTIEFEAVKGYYGNIINRLKVSLEENDAIEFVKNLFNIMSEGDKLALINTIDIRYDKKSNEIYIRLSKQDAYLGFATLYNGDDAIKIIVTFAYKKSLSDVKKLIESLAKGFTDNAI
ncbi:MAG: RNA-binding domain-containing protein [Ignisphaera sp.]